MKRRLAIAVLVVGALAALPGQAAFAADPPAKSAGEEIVSFVTTGKIRVAKKLTYQFSCGVVCDVRLDIELLLPGRNYTPPPAEATGVQPGQIYEDSLTPNGPLFKAIRANRGKAKLRSTITATSKATGEVDIDRRTFRFK